MSQPYAALGMNSKRELKEAMENGDLSSSEAEKAKKILAD
jgi:hypothetical protein